MNSFISDLKDYFHKEIRAISHPSKNTELTFDEKNHDVCFELISRILDAPSEETSFARLSHDFKLHFYKIKNWKEDEIPASIGGLSALFEVYLRKIAYIKFKDNDLFYGNSEHNGIQKSTLYDLIDGTLANKQDPRNLEIRTKFPSRLAPDSSSPIEWKNLDFLRDKIRNDIHNATSYNRKKILKNSNIIFTCYYIVTVYNFNELKSYFLQEFKYLKNIVDDELLVSMSATYTNLFAIMSPGNKSNSKLCHTDEIKFESLEYWNDFQIEDIDGNINEEFSDSVQVREDIFDIINSISRLYLVGEPGSGKTSTAKKILFENATLLIRGNAESKFPIYIKASSISTSRDLNLVLEQALGDIQLSDLYKKYKILILIDGINEIELNVRSLLVQDISYLLEIYRDISLIITTRKVGFVNELNLDCVELISFSETQIIETLRKKIKNKSNWIWDNLKKNHDLLVLAKNPLLLQMIISVFEKKDEFPKNKGLLYNLFVDILVDRSKKYLKLNNETKKEIISSLAFSMFERNEVKKIKKEKAKKRISDIFIKRGLSIDFNDFIDELIESNLFLPSADGDSIEFFHETYQEYFVAFEIKRHYLSSGTLFHSFIDEKWERAYILCADLFKEKSDLENYFNDLLIGKRTNSNFDFYNIDFNLINTSTYVPSKIAYNFSKLSQLSEKCEVYLINLFAIWAGNHKIPKFNSVFKEIIRSVAALGSDKLFFRVFSNINSLENLFLDSLGSDLRKSKEFSETTDVTSFTMSSMFLQNCSDPLKGFLFFEDMPQKYFSNIRLLSSELSFALKTFISNLQALISIEELKHAYEINFDKRILKEIGKHDLEYFYQKCANHDISSTDLVKYLVKFSKYIDSDKNLLLSFVCDKSFSIDDRLLIVNRFLSKGYFSNDLLEKLQQLFSVNDELLISDGIKRIFQRLPFSLLEKYNLHKIFVEPKLTYEEISCDLSFYDEDFLYFKPFKDNLNFRYIEYKGVQFTDYEIVYATFYSLAFRCGVDSSTFARVKSELSSSSNVHFGVFDLENQRIINLKAHKITAESKKNSVVFEISNYEYSRLSKIKFSQIILFEGLRFDISESFEIQSRGLLLKTNSSLFNNDTETIHFDYFDENFDFERPYLYHKEQIYSNQRLINILKLKIFDPKVTDFIKNIGIAHLFEKYIPELSKGFVIKSRPDGFYVYDLKRKNIIFSTALSLSSSIPLGSCVNIECDNSISLTSPSTLGDSFFKEGVIVKISSDGDLTEGFIRSGNTKDFYFNNYFSDSYNLFQKCLVKFIPGLNYRFKQTVHSLLALCVRIDYSKYSISKVTFFDTHQVENELIYVELFDILTCEKLFTKYNSSFPIHQFDGQFRLGQHFIYSKRLKQRHKAMTYIRLDRYLGLTL